MLALLTDPGTAHSTTVEEVADPAPATGEVLLRTLRVGVCGTDREIAEGLFGVPPDGDRRLILGHEVLARVERDAPGFERGEIVTATVRRSCGHCAACEAGAPDACMTGDYLERGITRLHGFASEFFVESPEHLVRVPPELGGLGVLAEPASICARGIRHALAVGGRQPWRPSRALVLGAGAIGMLATYLLRLEGFEVWTAALGPARGEKPELVEACGARYVSADDAGPAAADVGGFDVVIEATGDAQVMIDTLALLARGGVACLLGLDARPRAVTLEGRVIGVDAILQNRALLASVNANRVDWLTAVDHLDRARRRWPDALAGFVGLEVPVDRFGDAFAYSGVKATVTF